MSSSTIVPHTSTSPRCDDRNPELLRHTRQLACAVVPQAAVTPAERSEMYDLLQTYFLGTDRGRFEADLREKELVILLRDAASGQIQGFSTLMHMITMVDGQEIVAFFSGDTIVDREYWGDTLLSRAWGQTVFAEVDRISTSRPFAAFYWFLICSGYKTWRFLPLFFRRFYPHPGEPTPASARRILDTLGAAKFGDQYRRSAGIVRFAAATPLRPGVADVSDRRLRDPYVAFFARVNPGHVAGDELACLAELSRANLTRAAARMMAHPL